MNTTFEQSKQFSLTKEEDSFLKGCIESVINLMQAKASNSTLYIIHPDAIEDIATKAPISNENWRWFFGRAMCVAFSIKIISRTANDAVYECTLPDRSTFTFSHKDLQENLYDIGRFYFARTFDHSYESLRSTGNQWANLDNYVKERKQILRNEEIVKRLPELDGIF